MENGNGYRDPALVEAEALRARDEAFAQRDAARRARKRISILAGVAVMTAVGVFGVGMLYIFACCEIAVHRAEESAAEAHSEVASLRQALLDKAAVECAASVAAGRVSVVASPQVISPLGCSLASAVIAGAEGVTAGRVAVLTGAFHREPSGDDTPVVADASASKNLTTVYGVALTSATSGNRATVCRRGPVRVRAEPGVRPGDVVGTSCLEAGAVQSYRKPEPGAVVGRSMEETGNTRAGEVILDVGVE